MDSVMGTKIIVLLLLAIIKLVAGLVPMFIFSRVMRMSARVVDTVLAVALCVGAGVLLSTVFIHMVPETRESLDIAAAQGYLPDPHYPFAELFMCLGFFLIYGIEVTVHTFLSGSHGEGVVHGHSHGVPIAEMVPNRKSSSKSGGGGMDNGAYTVTESDSSSGRGSSESRSRRNSRSNSSGSSDDSGDLGLPKRVTSRPANRRPSLARSDASKTAVEKALSRERRILTTIRNVLVVLALSLHSVFEGMAVGLQMTSSDVWKLFVAIALHAVPILFCIGMEMTSGATKKRHMVFYIVFVALATPLGVTIGLVVTEHVDATSGVQTLVIGILQGLAGGTLFYITFFEVLDKEKLSRGGMSGLLGFCFIFAGFAIMAAVNAMGHNHGLEGHGHSHGHGHAHGGHGAARSGQQQVHVGGGGGHGHEHDDHHDGHEHESHDHDHGEIIDDYVDEIERNLAIGHDKFSFHRHNHQHNHPQQRLSHNHQHNHRHNEQHGHEHDGHEDHSDHDHSHEHDDDHAHHEQVSHDSHEAHEHSHESHDHSHESHDQHDHDYHDYEDHDHAHDHEDHDHGHSHEEVASTQRPAAAPTATRRLRRRIPNPIRNSYPIPYQYSSS